jgi:predicted phage terminase large subunit-like protein
MVVLGGLDAEALAYGDLRFFSEWCWRGAPGHLPNAPFHGEIYDVLQYRGELGEKFRETHRLHLEAPREHAKTTAVSVKYVLWRVGRDPNLRVVVISRTGALAASINREVRRNIENNPRFRRVFPEVEPDSPWGDEQFQVKRSSIMKSPTFYGTGLEGSVTGIRGDLLILDDPFDLNEVRTQAQRDKVRDWINSVTVSILPPSGEMICVGTRWHEEDYWGGLLEKSVEKGGDWVCKVYRAVENYEDPPSEWRVLWPQRWSAEALEKRRRDVGSLMFRSLYQNDPFGLQGAVFKRDWLSYYDPAMLNATVTRHLDYIMAVDPAIGESVSADRTAIVTIAVNRRNSDIYVLDIWADRVDFPTQVKKIVEYGRKRRRFGDAIAVVRKIGVESLFYQKALYSSLYQTGLPVVEVKGARGPKEMRIFGLQPHFENGRIKLPGGSIIPNWMGKFMEEYLAYPRGKHDDILDSLQIAVELARTTPGKSSIDLWVGRTRI